MRPKTIKLLIIALILLIVGLYGQQWWQQRQLYQSTGWTELSNDIQTGNVNKINIQSGDDSITLSLIENQWQVGDKIANKIKVDELLTILNKPKVELVSQNISRYEELGISDQKAKRLIFEQGENTKFVILVSNSDDKLIRMEGKQNVYRLNNSLSLTTDEKDWIEEIPESKTDADISEQ